MRIEKDNQPLKNETFYKDFLNKYIKNLRNLICRINYIR